MTLSIGEIDRKIGNAIRSEIIRWCSEYQYDGDVRKNNFFGMVKVEINPIDYLYLRRAVEVEIEIDCIRGEYALKLQTDLLKFSEALKEQFDVSLDHLEVEDDRVQFYFLAPDSQRILRKEKGWG